MRKLIPFLLLGMVAVVGGAFALLGLAMGGSTVSLGTAVTNTLSASGYTEDLSEATPQGSQTAHIVYDAPDRLGGWIQSAGRRTYLVIIGTTEYVSVSGSPKADSKHLVFYKQTTTGAQAVDPAHTYLAYWNRGPSVTDGDTTTVTLSQGGQTEKLIFTVDGKYVSRFKAVTPGGTIVLDITDVGTSPAVALPAGAVVRSGQPGLQPQG
jgi:hypothetical protein